SIMLNMRDNTNRGVVSPNGRRVCTSADMGETWAEHSTSHRVLTEPTCMAALHKHEYTDAQGRQQTMLLFSNPNHHKLREDMTLKASFDDGTSWPEAFQILYDQTRCAGYSSLTSVDDRTIGLLYESGLADLVFIQFDIDEILNPNK
ncbi:MAG: glycoside hydrolase, partial [Muribaculaceae bacterium]|nr:glycoside hydrolase [Muribaculaceae bacterium]